MTNEKVWPCICGGNHFLSVAFWDDDPEGAISLIDGTHCSLWCRIKSAFKLIRTGAAPHYGVEVILTPENVPEIIQAMTDAGKKIGTPRADG